MCFQFTSDWKYACLVLVILFWGLWWLVAFSEMISNSATCPSGHRFWFILENRPDFWFFLVRLTSCPTWASVKSRQTERVFSEEPGRAAFRTWTGITTVVLKACDQLWLPQGGWIVVQMCFDWIWRWDFPINNTHSYYITVNTWGQRHRHLIEEFYH